jgi:polyisoprenoid-binding protein YceI
VSTAKETLSLESGSWKLEPSDAIIEFVTRTFWGAVPVKGTFSDFTGSWDL